MGHWFDPWILKIPWRRAWQPTPVFLFGVSYRQRSLAGCSPWGHEESDMTEATEHAWACQLPGKTAEGHDTRHHFDKKSHQLGLGTSP